MTTLDDRILGEKLQYYYSSSEDEGSDNEEEDGENKTIRDANVEEPEIEYSADGSAVNTGTNTHAKESTFRIRPPCANVMVKLSILSQDQRVSSMTGGSTSSWRWSRNKSRNKRWKD